MTEFFDDLVGFSAHLHGNEERIWKGMIDKLDLTDHYLTSVARNGSLFTRQARSGAWFDQTKSSNRGSWHSFVRQLEHDNK